MGIVYRARHLSLDRVVALKMILTGDHAAPAELARFQAEARAVARLQHPHIVQVHDHGIHDGKPYLALEYCAGGSLAARLDGTPLPPRKAAALMEHLAEAVAAAHHAGIVHRDLKPGNILLADGDWEKGKIADFGLAKKLDDDSGQTRSGSILGTPSYMAPEQALGDSRHVGPAADQYALGAILYELLTGRPPFKGATVLETLEMVRTQEPVPPRQLQPKTPRDLETIGLKCLRKEPARRYASARELADDLRRFQQGEPVRARPVGRLERLARWARRRPAVAGLLLLTLLVAAGGLAGILWAYGQALDQRDQALSARQETRRSLYFSRVNLAHSEWLSGNVDRAEQLLDACPREFVDLEWHYLKRLCHAEESSRPLDAWGHEVALGKNGTLLVTCTDKTAVVWDPASGRDLLKITPRPGLILQSASLRPDGKQVAVGMGEAADPGRPGEVEVWDVETGERVHHFSNFETGIWSVAFNADGTRLAAVGGIPSRDLPRNGTLFVWDLAKGEKLLDLPIPFTQGFPIAQVKFSPDDRFLAVASRALVVLDARMGAEVLSSSIETICLAFAARPEAAYLAIGDMLGQVYVWNTSDWTVEWQSPATGTPIRCLAFSPDGQTVASGDHENLIRLWTVGSQAVPQLLRGHRHWVDGLAFHPERPRLFSISADWTMKRWDLSQPAQSHCTRDGTAVAFGSGDEELVVARGTNLEFRTNADPRALRPELALDQEITVLERDPAGNLLAVGGQQGLVGIHDLKQQSWRPLPSPHRAPIVRMGFDRSGQRLFSADTDGVLVLWDTTTGTVCHPPWQGLRSSYQCVALRPDGQVLVYAIAEETRLQVTLVFWDVARQQELGRRTFYQGRACAFSPDGRYLAINNGRDIHVWDEPTGWPWTGAAGRKFQGHFYLLFDLRFSADNRRLASLGHDQTLRLWDVATGEATLRLPVECSTLSRLCISPRGHYLAMNQRGHGLPGNAGLRLFVFDARPWSDEKATAESR
jgi:WD40 repeat protein